MSTLDNTAVPETDSNSSWMRFKHWGDSILENEALLGYVLLVPMLVVVIGLIGYPFTLSIYYSLTDKVLAQQDLKFRRAEELHRAGQRSHFS